MKKQVDCYFPNHKANNCDHRTAQWLTDIDRNLAQICFQQAFHVIFKEFAQFQKVDVFIYKFFVDVFIYILHILIFIYSP